MTAVRAYVLSATLMLVAACGGGGAPVQSPTMLAAARSTDLTEQAILDALPKRAWTPENVEPGRILAFHAKGPHMLRVEIRYDDRQIGIYYVDSNNLSARVGSDGQVYAHGHVNRWIRALALDIASALAAGGATAGGAAPTPAQGAGAAPPASPPAAPPAAGAPAADAQ